jgi:hypothetical protein
MSNLSKGTFTLNLGFVQLGGELAQEDRQCAWELYTELSTRVAVTGKQNDPECRNFEGEIYAESLNSLYAFFQESRAIMRRFPVGRIDGKNDQHLGVLINRVMCQVLRPFLEKWQAQYRHWWEHESNPRLPPMQRQAEFPELDSFLSDWADVRALMRALEKELVKAYQLVDVGANEP